jgi:hypothetical protein
MCVPGPWIELELEQRSSAAPDEAAAIVMKLRARGMKIHGDGPTWRTDVETDDLEVATETVAGALTSIDEHWEAVLAIGPARG